MLLSGAWLCSVLCFVCRLRFNAAFGCAVVLCAVCCVLCAVCCVLCACVYGTRDQEERKRALVYAHPSHNTPTHPPIHTHNTNTCQGGRKRVLVLMRDPLGKLFSALRFFHFSGHRDHGLIGFTPGKAACISCSY